MEIPYLASVEWYAGYLSAFLRDEELQPLTDHRMLNRCRIIGANGEQTLSVPIVGGGKILKRQSKTEILLSEHGNWRHLHWGAIFSAYGNAPFFEHYAPIFEPLFSQDFSCLRELNEAFHNEILKILKINELKDYCLTINKSAFSTEYYQIRADKFGFISRLSILDLIFNMGPQSIFVLLAHNHKP